MEIVKKDLVIRPECESDAPAISLALTDAFAKVDPSVPALVDALREADALLHTVVALEDGVVVGYAAASRCSSSEAVELDLVRIAPVGVVTRRQRAGIGTAMMRALLGAC